MIQSDLLPGLREALRVIASAPDPWAAILERVRELEQTKEVDNEPA